jgi:hypothetical protein
MLEGDTGWLQETVANKALGSFELDNSKAASHRWPVSSFIPSLGSQTGHSGLSAVLP